MLVQAAYLQCLHNVVIICINVEITLAHAEVVIMLALTEHLSSTVNALEMQINGSVSVRQTQEILQITNIKIA
jgi:hypothetical protein